MGKEQGQKWLDEVFEDNKPAEVNESKQQETKAEVKKRIQKQKIKRNLLELAQLKKQCK